MENSNLFENVSAETLDTFVTLGAACHTYYSIGSFVGIICFSLATVSLMRVRKKQVSSNFMILSCISLALFCSTFVTSVSSVMYSVTWEQDHTAACTASVYLVIAFYILHLTAMLLFLYQRSELVRVSRAAKEATFVRVLRKVTLMATLGTPPGGITLALIFARGGVYQGRCLLVYDPILTLLVLVLNTILSAQYLLLFMIPLTSHWSSATHTNRHQSRTLEVNLGEDMARRPSTKVTSSDKLKSMAKKNMILSTAAITTSLTTFIYNTIVVEGDPNYLLKAHLLGNVDMGVNGAIILFSTSIWVPDLVKKKFTSVKQYYAKRGTKVSATRASSTKNTTSTVVTAH